jgi:hypothetical protein
MELRAGKGVVQNGVLAGSFYRSGEGGGGGQEGRVVTVNGHLQWSVTGVKEGGCG